MLDITADTLPHTTIDVLSGPNGACIRTMMPLFAGQLNSDPAQIMLTLVLYANELRIQVYSTVSLGHRHVSKDRLSDGQTAAYIINK